MQIGQDDLQCRVLAGGFGHCWIHDPGYPRLVSNLLSFHHISVDERLFDLVRRVVAPGPDLEICAEPSPPPHHHIAGRPLSPRSGLGSAKSKRIQQLVESLVSKSVTKGLDKDLLGRLLGDAVGVADDPTIAELCRWRRLGGGSLRRRPIPLRGIRQMFPTARKTGVTIHLRHLFLRANPILGARRPRSNKSGPDRLSRSRPLEVSSVRSGSRRPAEGGHPTLSGPASLDPSDLLPLCHFARVGPRVQRGVAEAETTILDTECRLS
jgi:hypothetical protein